MSQPGPLQHVEATQHQYTASPYNQAVSMSSGPPSLSQPAPSPGFPPGTTSSYTTGMAAPVAPLASNNSLNNQQKFMAPNGTPQLQGLQAQVQQPISNQPQNQLQNQVQQGTSNTSSNTPLSPQSASREKTRVAVLLEINSHLLQDVMALQTQGKAGVAPGSQPQHSPTQESPPSSATTEHNPMNSSNSPVDPSKPGKPPTVEYVEDMKRLQANLAYLAAVADRNKGRNLPNGPAIMAPPPHLKSVVELYKKLNALFPGAPASVKASPTASGGNMNATGQQSG
ncbi:MAG: hypothetical protein Q9227_009392 [Pyrenula ochraceoflavens]